MILRRENGMIDYDYTQESSQVEWTEINDELTDLDEIVVEIDEAEQWQEHMDSLGEYAAAALKYFSSNEDEDGE